MFWGLVQQVHYNTIRYIIATYTRTYFASPRDSVSVVFYVIFARALCFFQNRDTIFIASFFIYNTSIYSRWFPFIRWHTSSSLNKLVLLPSGDAIRACPPAILSCETIGYSQLVYLYFHDILNIIHSYFVCFFVSDFGAMYLKDPLEEINEAKVLL